MCSFLASHPFQIYSIFSFRRHWEAPHRGRNRVTAISHTTPRKNLDQHKNGFVFCCCCYNLSQAQVMANCNKLLNAEFPIFISKASNIYGWVDIRFCLFKTTKTKQKKNDPSRAWIRCNKLHQIAEPDTGTRNCLTIFCQRASSFGIVFQTFNGLLSTIFFFFIFISHVFV